MRKISYLGLFLTFALVASACGGSDDDGGSAGGGAATTTTAASTYKKGTVPDEASKATITTNMGTIVVDLDFEKAPIAATRFAELAAGGFYDGLTFHRAVGDFVIQGGYPSGDGTGGTGDSVVGETPTDGYPLGSLAAAKGAGDEPGTFDCQFFIVTGDRRTGLSNDYARFGMVTEGMDVAKKIEGLAPPGGDGAPTETVSIESIKIT
jgi:cyclophilin family peptidyl-prolyl cis-trans isomerase